MDMPYRDMLVPAATASGCVLALLAIRSVLFRLLHAWAKRTGTVLDDIIVESTRNPSVLFAAAIGVHIGLSVSGMSEKHMGYLARCSMSSLFCPRRLPSRLWPAGSSGTTSKNPTSPFRYDRPGLRHPEGNDLRHRLPDHADRSGHFDRAPHYRPRASAGLPLPWRFRTPWPTSSPASIS